MDVAQHLIEVNRANKEAESKSLKQDQLNSRKLESEIKDAPLVLIIDDSVTVRELLSMTFKKAGYRVEQARDGQEAWNKLSGGLNCDLAFCDIEMPRMNGLELLSQLQKDEKLSSLPIAMLTSRGAQKMRNIAAKRGANGYFVKPYVEDDLLEAARRMMNGEMLIENIDEDNFGD
jgi:CheY-like chemotaxis protein